MIASNLILISGNFSDIPSASSLNTDQFYFSIDTTTLYYSDGSSWTNVGSGGGSASWPLVSPNNTISFGSATGSSAFIGYDGSFSFSSGSITGTVEGDLSATTYAINNGLLADINYLYFPNGMGPLADYSGQLYAPHGIVDSNDATGTSGQILSSTGNGTSWVNAGGDSLPYSLGASTDFAQSSLTELVLLGTDSNGNIVIGSMDSGHNPTMNSIGFDINGNANVSGPLVLQGQLFLQSNGIVDINSSVGIPGQILTSNIDGLPAWSNLTQASFPIDFEYPGVIVTAASQSILVVDGNGNPLLISLETSTPFGFDGSGGIAYNNNTFFDLAGNFHLTSGAGLYDSTGNLGTFGQALISSGSLAIWSPAISVGSNLDAANFTFTSGVLDCYAPNSSFGPVILDDSGNLPAIGGAALDLSGNGSSAYGMSVGYAATAATATMTEQSMENFFDAGIGYFNISNFQNDMEYIVGPASSLNVNGASFCVDPFGNTGTTTPYQFFYGYCGGLSQFINDVGYLTSAAQAGDNISEFTNDAGYITGGSIVTSLTSDIGAISLSSNTGDVHITSLDLEGTFAGIIAGGLINNDISQFDNDSGYSTFNPAGTVAYAGDNVSEFINDAGYSTFNPIGAVAYVGDSISEFYNDAGYSTFNPSGLVAYQGDSISEFFNDAGYITTSDLNAYVAVGYATQNGGFSNFEADGSSYFIMIGGSTLDLEDGSTIHLDNGSTLQDQVGTGILNLPKGSGTLALQTPAVATISYANPVYIDASTFSGLARISMVGDMLITAPSNFVDGMKVELWVTSSGGAFNLSFDTLIIIPSESTFTNPKILAANKTYIILLKYDAVTNGGQWELVSLVGGY